MNLIFGAGCDIYSEEEHFPESVVEAMKVAYRPPQQSDSGRSGADMTKSEYIAAMRHFRVGELWRVPLSLSFHVWDVKQHVAEMALPEFLQYHPMTEALQLRRDERIAGWFGAEYEKARGI